jgi:hypothetical protein
MFEQPKEQPVNKPYRKLQVDDLPIIEKEEQVLPTSVYSDIVSSPQNWSGSS